MRSGFQRLSKSHANRGHHRVGKRTPSYGRRDSYRGSRSRGPAPLLHLPNSQQGDLIDDPPQQSNKPYLRVANLHPDLTEGDLTKLFEGIGPVEYVNLQFNTRGESTGIAFVGYQNPRDCQSAIDKFDGRRAAGQVISVENAVPLVDRIGISGSRGGSGYDRGYAPRHRGGFRGGRVGARGGRRRGDGSERRPRPAKKTVEDLDAELSSYMGENANAGVAPPPSSSSSAAPVPESDPQQLPQQQQQPAFPAVDNGEMALD
ncbi:unnamed protein product [Ambrosiozyma monospora]|uniref:Unnamed protein product n=1 Tax=Ambrosiozyma monospora TaxID=43982 RepID=A0ACB5T4M3_AMBMO|nr:unnamed protein product [Ambrosiozyma monospora]